MTLFVQMYTILLKTFNKVVPLKLWMFLQSLNMYKNKWITVKEENINI